jgi:hypothetical protein
MWNSLQLKQVSWIVALVAAGALPSLAQQPAVPKPDDLQKQLEQLKTTRPLMTSSSALLPWSSKSKNRRKPAKKQRKGPSLQ